MTWKYETDSEGDFVYYDNSKSEKALDDESFTIYLPAESKKREAAINRIVNSLNRSGIRP